MSKKKNPFTVDRGGRMSFSYATLRSVVSSSSQSFPRPVLGPRPGMGMGTRGLFAFCPPLFRTPSATSSTVIGRSLCFSAPGMASINRTLSSIKRIGLSLSFRMNTSTARIPTLYGFFFPNRSLYRASSW